LLVYNVLSLFMSFQWVVSTNLKSAHLGLLEYFVATKISTKIPTAM
jgi:hypothetical protein